jgi:RNA recognition motif-containing protein
MFDAHGRVVSTTIIRDHISGRSRGFGFVEIEILSDTENAVNALNN